MKKIISLLLCAVILLCLFSLPASAEGISPEITTSNAVCVLNVDNGQIIFSRRADEQLAPTCAAKLVSMMVVRELFTKHGISDDTVITVSQESLRGIGEAGDLSAPRLGLTPDSEYTAADLISASLVANANDACSALAYYCARQLLGGTIDDFVSLMNAKAKEAGANDTVFKNCTGLNTTGMFSTVSDVARISALFYTHNDLMEVANQPSFRLAGAMSAIHNKNYLLSSHLLVGYQTAAAKGMIAGQRTNLEGYTLITASETSDGIAYVYVVMDAVGETRDRDGNRSFAPGNAYDDMVKLIPWASSSFAYRLLAADSEPVAELRVDLGKNFDYVSLVPEEKLELLVNTAIDPSTLTRTVVFADKVYKGDYNGIQTDMVDAPVNKGDVLGRLVFSYGGEVLGSVQLVASSTVETSGLMLFIVSFRDFIFSETAMTILKWLLIAAAVFIAYSFVAFVVRKILASRRKKKEKRNEKSREEAKKK